MPSATEAAVIAVLAAHREGMSASAIRDALPGKPSQPTLHRTLVAMMRHGRIVSIGKARATRYRLSGSDHLLHDWRSLLYHQRIADRLADDPGLLAKVRDRLEFLRRVNPGAGQYYDRWERLIDGPLAGLRREMVAESEQCDAMRQASPFTILITDDDRREVLLKAMPRGGVWTAASCN